MPIRIQRKRTKGWRKPEGAVYVGRGTKWGNPFEVGMILKKNRAPLDVDEVVDQYRINLERLMKMRGANIQDLRGKDLMCFCPLDQPCHADVLLEIANAT